MSGESFESFARQRLLVPLEMTSACFTADDAITYSVATPHWIYGDRAIVIRGAGWQPGWELGPVDRPAAGLIASVEHLMTWCRFQQTGTSIDGSVMLSQSSLRRLHTPVVNASCIEDIALDWHVWTIDGATAIGHGGLTAGFASDLVIVPEADFAFVGLTNGTNGAMVYDEVRRWALERCAGLIERDPEPDPALVVDASRYVGRYVHSFSQLTVTPGDAPGTVVVTGSPRDDLTDSDWQPPVDPPFTCGFFAPDHAISSDPAGTVHIAKFGFDDPNDDRGGLVAVEWTTGASGQLSRVCRPGQAGSTITIVRPVVRRSANASTAAGRSSNATT